MRENYLGGQRGTPSLKEIAMKAIKFQKPKFNSDNLFVVILTWYLVGSLSLLIIMYILEWFIH